MRVFLSWSGERSQNLASALRDWLPLVLHYAEPWLSKTDINAGERWSLEVAKELDASGFGVSCITAENSAAPWLLFEAGALAKSLQEGRVVPLLLGLDFSDISGPFAQFQAKKADRSGIWETICGINQVSTTPVLGPKLEQLFEALWPSLEASIDAIPSAPKPAKHSRPQGEVLEELVSSVRNLDARMRDDSEEGRYPRGSKRSHMREMMMNEFIHRMPNGPSDPVSILIAASLLRDDFPWIYDLAQNLSNSLASGNIRGARMHARRLHDAVRMIGRTPLGSEYGGRNFHMLLDVAGIALSQLENQKSEKLTGAKGVAEERDELDEILGD